MRRSAFGVGKIPFISAMAMLGGKDGESDSYLDLADIIASESVTPDQDREELFRGLPFPFSSRTSMTLCTITDFCGAGRMAPLTGLRHQSCTEPTAYAQKLR